jgi:hypothetical protein
MLVNGILKILFVVLRHICVAWLRALLHVKYSLQPIAYQFEISLNGTLSSLIGAFLVVVHDCNLVLYVCQL